VCSSVDQFLAVFAPLMYFKVGYTLKELIHTHNLQLTTRYAYNCVAAFLVYALITGLGLIATSYASDRNVKVSVICQVSFGE
jgi:hypothetical protein